MRSAALFLLVLGLAACRGDGTGGGWFSVDQREALAEFEATLPARLIERWSAAPLPEETQLAAVEPADCPAIYCELLREWYAARGHERALVGAGDALTTSGAQLLDLLGELHLHALPRADYYVDEIEALRSELRGIVEAEAQEAPPQIDEALLVEAAQYFHALDRRRAVSEEAALAWLDAQETPELVARREGLWAHHAQREHLANQLEWHMAIAWLAYADTQRARNVHYWDEPTLVMAGVVVIDPEAPVTEGEAEAHTLPKTIAAERTGVAPELLEDRRKVLRVRRLQTYVDALDSDAIGELGRSLDPPFEQYAELRASLARYLAFARAGGWETELEIPRALRRGMRADVLPRVRARLQAEGYITASNDELEDPTRFDATLDAAIRDYQRTHQFDENGRLTANVLASMNRSVETRIAEIAVALEDWRMNPMGRDYAGYRIEINVPDFHAEVWDGDTRLSRFRVVVGRYSRDGAVVETKTPLFSDRLSRVVFNPYWYIPQSIMHHEIFPQMEEDPEFLEANNYELRELGNFTYIRQLPGPGNALGEVKFLFPNEYAVYMHDTPTKHLFGRSTRAFSHGCIRVQDPMDFAELLLSRDRDWTVEQARYFIRREQRRREGEIEVELRAPVPVHIRYMGVNVVDGAPHFLADVYRTLGDRVDAQLVHVEEWTRAVANDG